MRREGGLILALPADAALHARVDALFSGTATKRPKLGVAIAPPHVARRLRRAVGLDERDGVLVRGVEDGLRPNRRRGLAPRRPDRRAGYRTVDSVDVLYDALDAAVAGGELALTMVRGDEERSVAVTFGSEA